MTAKKISQLPVGAAATGGPFPLVQSGVTVQRTISAAGAALIEAANATAQRTAMGLGTAATNNTGDFDAAGSAAAAQAASLQVSSNLSDLGSVATALINLGFSTLGTVGLQVLATAAMSAGSLFYASALNTFGELPIGTAGQVLTVVGGLPAWAANGNGTVTSVVAGTGLNVGAGPGGTITTTGTLNLADTAVTPGSYTLTNLTVDAQGRITLAASGTVNLATQVTGTLPIANGGTGATTLAGAGIATGSGVAGQVTFWTGTNTIGGDTLFLYNSTTDQMTLSAAAVASANTATLMIGAGGFAGTAPNFVGNALGTYLAVNSMATFAGSYIDLQSAGNSIFRVNAVASAVNGIEFTPTAVGTAGVAITATGGTNEAISLNSKGTGSVTLNTGSSTSGVMIRMNYAGNNRYNFLNRSIDWTPSQRTTTQTQAAFLMTTGADTTLTLSTEVFDQRFNNSATKQWATGAITTQRDFVIDARTYAFVGASTVTHAATFAITGAPIAGTNATLTTSDALWVQSGMARFDGGITTSSLSNTGQFLGAAGSAGAPTYSYTADPDTGAFSVGANDWGVSTSGTLRFDISTTRGLFTLPFQVTDATASAIQAGSATLGAGLVIGTSASIFQADAAASGSDARFGFRPLASTTIAGIRLTLNSTTEAMLDAGTFDAGGTFSAAKTLSLNPSAGLIKLGGALQLANAYVAGVQVPTGYVIIKDNTGTDYKVSVNA